MTHFDIREFDCKCGCGANRMSHGFLMKLDKARGIAGIPFIVNSGTRCEKHNRAVGGVEGSSHTLGEAADIAAPDSHSRFIIVSALLQAGIRRIKVYDTFVHAGDNPNKPQDQLML